MQPRKKSHYIFMFLFGLVILGLAFSTSWDRDSFNQLKTYFDPQNPKQSLSHGESGMNPEADEETEAVRYLREKGYQRCIHRVKSLLPPESFTYKSVIFTSANNPDGELMTMLSAEKNDPGALSSLAVSSDSECTATQQVIMPWQKACGLVIKEHFATYEQLENSAPHMSYYLQGDELVTAIQLETACLTIETSMNLTE